MPPQPPRFKKIAFLVPKPGMALDDFHAYWRDTHGPTVATAPGYASWRTRYAQNHNLGPAPAGAPFPYRGAAVFHLPGDGSNEAAYAASATYRDHVRPDELNFIDMDRTVSMAAVEHVVVPGDGPAKILLVGARRPGLDRADFDANLLAACAAARGFMAQLRGWVVNLGVTGTLTLPGARPGGGLAVDCVQEIWFGSDAEMAGAFGSDAWRVEMVGVMGEVFAADGVMGFRAGEVVFFDGGLVSRLCSETASGTTGSATSPRRIPGGL